MSSEETLKILRDRIDEIMAENHVEGRAQSKEVAPLAERDDSFGFDGSLFESNESVGCSSIPRQKKESRSRKAAPEEFEDTPQRAFSKITAILNVADKSEYALRERLSKAGFGQESIDQAVERAKSYGFIDDLRYADLLIRSRLSQGKGSAGIERELKEHRIAPDSVPGWPFEYGVEQDAETERAIEFLKRKPPRSKNARDGAYRKLMQKGFPSSVASSAARIWAESDWA